METLSTIAQKQEKLGDRQGALETLDFLRDLSRKAERSYEKSAANRSIMRAQLALGRTREALQDAGSLNETDQRAALLMIAGSLTNRGKRDEALQVAESFKDPQFKAYAIMLVAEQDAENDRRQQAIAALGQARRIVDALGDPEEKPGMLAYIGAIEARMAIPGASDTFAAAISLARGIENDSSRDKQLESVAKQIARAKRFKEAVDLARSITDSTMQVQALTFIASYKETPIELSRELLDAVLPVARAMSEGYEKEWVLRDIASARAADGRMDQALATVELNLNPRHRQSALSSMARSVSSRGRIDEALGIAEKIGDKLQNELALAHIAGDVVKARGMKPAYDLVQSIKEDYARLTGLHNLINEGD